MFDAIDEELGRGPSPVCDALLEQRQQFFEHAAGDEDLRDVSNLDAGEKTSTSSSPATRTSSCWHGNSISRWTFATLDDNLEEEQQTKKQLEAMADDSAVRKSLQD
ncbi:hypothetical protein HALLA_00250 (plasmid) [Halostagnicola larsenii XH-48]|uniref:Uncharacterized protein n=1 Tax=Halostagnicola larsenii XH-48 TaxID=797299 RepID=W0JT43_9EURY|nr:hypothetical protein HALLA_00250 [Halostagnicola larsenii XH-48]